jgi:hypothetical protein
MLIRQLTAGEGLTVSLFFWILFLTVYSLRGRGKK